MSNNSEHVIVDLSCDPIGILEYMRPTVGAPKCVLESSAPRGSLIDSPRGVSREDIEVSLASKIKEKIRAHHTWLSFLVPTSACLIESCKMPPDAGNVKEWARRRVGSKTGMDETSLVVDVHKTQPVSQGIPVVTIIAIKREDIQPLLRVVRSLKANLACIMPAIFPRAALIDSFFPNERIMPWGTLHLWRGWAELSVWWNGSPLTVKDISLGPELWSDARTEVNRGLELGKTLFPKCRDAACQEPMYGPLAMPCSIILRGMNAPHPPPPYAVSLISELPTAALDAHGIKVSVNNPAHLSTGIFDGLLGSTWLLSRN